MIKDISRNLKDCEKRGSYPNDRDRTKAQYSSMVGVVLYHQQLSDGKEDQDKTRDLDKMKDPVMVKFPDKIQNQIRPGLQNSCQCCQKDTCYHEQVCCLSGLEDFSKKYSQAGHQSQSFINDEDKKGIRNKYRNKE